MSITRENYYDTYGVSNSSLNYALPECGGSYKKFRAFMAGEIGKEETPEMKLGTLIHKFLENPSTVFQVIKNMPSEAICRIIKDIAPDTRPELKDYPKEIVVNARHYDYQRGWGDEAICKKIVTEGSEYFKALHSGNTIIDQETSDLLQNISNEIRKDYSHLLDDKAFEALAGADWKVMKEAAFSWVEDEITFKMLIDRLEINDKRKEIDFYDFKTTSKPLSLYMGYKGYKVEGSTADLLSIVEDFHHGTMLYYHVPRQIQFYKRGLQQLFPGYKVTGHVVAIEVNAPYEIAIFNISAVPAYEKYGDMLIDRALKKVSEFFEKEISI
jgi:hypothetical protein